VVVRFNVTNSEEEGALSNAADRLFLDVWAFTDDYVDVRLRKDDVVSLMTLLPSTMQPSVLIPDVAAAVWATYPSGKNRFGPDWADTAMLRNQLDGVDNIFFRDYQPLSVSIPRRYNSPQEIAVAANMTFRLS
jgi:extracellular matrix protein 14